MDGQDGGQNYTDVSFNLFNLALQIRVQDVEIRHGVLQLNSKNTTLLGGEVAEMNEKPRIEVIMRTLRERLGCVSLCLKLAARCH